LIYFFIKSLIWFKQVKKLRDERDREALIEFSSKNDLRAIFALYALGDIGTLETLVDLKNLFLSSNLTKRKKMVSKTYNFIADKFGMPHLKPYILRIVGNELRIAETKSDMYESVQELPSVLEISIDEIPLSGRCMVSLLELHKGMEYLVACPHCFGVAKADLLKAWLDKEDTCPLCRKNLRITDCPRIVIRESDE
jgi:hypothetical protein